MAQYIENRQKVLKITKNTLKQRYVGLLSWFFVSYFVSLSVLSSVPSNEAVASVVKIDPVSTTVSRVVVEEPRRVVIDNIGVDTVVINPFRSDVASLDTELLKGVVRYPGSARLGEDANMFIFGHSSGLPVIINKAFKAFNKLGTLKVGDEIKVYGDTRIYIYRVVNVRLVDSNEALVELKTGKKILTLSTCNTFGEKEERFVVNAEFLSASELGQNNI